MFQSDVRGGFLPPSVLREVKDYQSCYCCGNDSYPDPRILGVSTPLRRFFDILTF